MSYGLHQVGLPKPRATIDEKRIVGCSPRTLGDSRRGSMGEGIRGTLHEVFKGVILMQWHRGGNSPSDMRRMMLHRLTDSLRIDWLGQRSWLRGCGLVDDKSNL